MKAFNSRPRRKKTEKERKEEIRGLPPIFEEFPTDDQGEDEYQRTLDKIAKLEREWGTHGYWDWQRHHFAVLAIVCFNADGKPIIEDGHLKVLPLTPEEIERIGGVNVQVAIDQAAERKISLREAFEEQTSWRKRRKKKTDNDDDDGQRSSRDERDHQEWDVDERDR